MQTDVRENCITLFWSCSRPTAVNLQIAATRLSAEAKREAAVEGGSGLSVAVAVIAAADAMMKDDIAANKACQPSSCFPAILSCFQERIPSLPLLNSSELWYSAADFAQYMSYMREIVTGCRVQPPQPVLRLDS